MDGDVQGRGRAPGVEIAKMIPGGVGRDRSSPRASGQSRSDLGRREFTYREPAIPRFNKDIYPFARRFMQQDRQEDAGV
jgi:hypothetical protein